MRVIPVYTWKVNLMNFHATYSLPDSWNPILRRPATSQLLGISLLFSSWSEHNEFFSCFYQAKCCIWVNGMSSCSYRLQASKISMPWYSPDSSSTTCPCTTSPEIYFLQVWCGKFRNINLSMFKRKKINFRFPQFQWAERSSWEGDGEDKVDGGVHEEARRWSEEEWWTPCSNDSKASCGQSQGRNKSNGNLWGNNSKRSWESPKTHVKSFILTLGIWASDDRLHRHPCLFGHLQQVRRHADCHHAQSNVWNIRLAHWYYTLTSV